MPHVEVRSRVGGATFQIQCKFVQIEKFLWRWNGFFIQEEETKIYGSLASECLAAKEEGAAVKKRMDTHKMAEANKAFSHFRF
jgi:small subunit ribosomal protein S7